MKNKLFIDDERQPVMNDFYIARTSQAAIKYVVENGVPDFISFDHDLGGDDTSIKFINWLVGKILDGENTLPSNFSYSVHSQNPVGAKNIQGKMDAFLQFIDCNK